MNEKTTRTGSKRVLTSILSGLSVMQAVPVLYGQREFTDAIVTNNTGDLKSGELLFPYVSIFTPTQFLEAISWQP